MDVMRGALLVLLVWAAVSDGRTGRISNRLILTGLSLGFFYRIWEEGLWGVIIFCIHISVPVIVLFLLFLMRVLGAGDIKLFSIISGICSLKQWSICLAAAFVAGAVLAVIRMVRLRNLNQRILCFGIYIRTLLIERSFFSYPFGAGEKESTIHFSITILIGYLVSLGVCG